MDAIYVQRAGVELVSQYATDIEQLPALCGTYRHDEHAKLSAVARAFPNDWDVILRKSANRNAAYQQRRRTGATALAQAKGRVQ